MRIPNTNGHIKTSISLKELDKSITPSSDKLTDPSNELSKTVETPVFSQNEISKKTNNKQEYTQYLIMKNRSLVKNLNADRGCFLSKENNINHYNLENYNDEDRDYDYPTTTSDSDSSSRASSCVIDPEVPPMEVPSLKEFKVIGIDLNKNGICAGLSVEWLCGQKNINSAAGRIASLDYDTDGYNSAKRRQINYNKEFDYQKSCSDSPLIDATSSLIEGAGLKQVSPSEHIYCSSNVADEIAQMIKKDNTAHFISLRFQRMSGHSVACFSKQERIHLFDSQIGEFECSHEQASNLVRGLLNHYELLEQEVVGVNIFKVH